MMASAPRNHGIVKQDKEIIEPTLVPNQCIASRTRRLSGTLSINSQDSLDQEQNSQPITVKKQAPECTLKKPPRLNHRRDYNELANGQERSNNVIIRRVARAYEKLESERNKDEIDLLREHAHLLPAAMIYLKRRHEKQILKQRLLETEESVEVIKAKALELANLIRDSRHVVIYTGAGISTSASIPDYRGPNGLWTQIKRTGNFSMTRVFEDLGKAEPTLTHMAISELCRRRMVKHVVSQNFDGLHLRSGVPQTQLSEIHGNMFIEICPSCDRQYFRQADVTQKTVRFRHKTGRQCHSCAEPNNSLHDTIVLYGERSRSRWPMNWERASRAAKRADLIICMGSSLKTLRRYGCLWPKTITTPATTTAMKRQQTAANGGSSSSAMQHETKLVIVNLQHTSKDKNAVLKISGKCDLVMEHVMGYLSIDVPSYELRKDPLQQLAVPFSQDELAKLKRNLIFAQINGSGGGNDDDETKTAIKVKGAPERKHEMPAALGERTDEEEEEEEDRGYGDAGGASSDDRITRAGRARKQARLGQRRSASMAKTAGAAATAIASPSCKIEAGAGDEDRCSPSMFVSELTPDPDKRRLRMRIRALTPSEV